MLLRLIRAEQMKLKRSPVWIAFLLMPIVPAVLGDDQLSWESGASHKRMVQPLDPAYAFHMLFLSADHGRYILCIHHAAGTE